jgi:hypothetical protein
MIKILHNWFERHGTKQSRQNSRPFQRVFPTQWLCEYRGNLARTPQVEHKLICVRLPLNEQDRSEDRSTQQIGGEIPTHWICAICCLPRDKGEARLLFVAYLGLRFIPHNFVQNWLATKITEALGRSLISASEQCFLIPCSDPDEFPWCLDQQSLTDYWNIEVTALYKLYRKELERSGLINQCIKK